MRGTLSENRRKQYVEVVAEHKVDGSVIPRTVVLVNGPQFQVELYRDPAVTEASGGRERHITYPIRANGVKTFLYEENGRWYVLMKER